MDDNCDKTTDTDGDKLFFCLLMFCLLCLISLFVGVSIGYSNGKFYGREEVWKQAVENNKAETLETSGGTLYRWKQ